MNSIRRARARPRRRTVNFRSFAWLLTYESAVRILIRTRYLEWPESEIRRWLVRREHVQVARLAEKYLDAWRVSREL